MLDEIQASKANAELSLGQTKFFPLKVVNRVAVAGLLGRLHMGEAEVMIGAIEKGIATVVLDDNTARNKAKQLGLDVTGTLGILLRAHKAGIIADLAQEIAKLRDAGMYLSEGIVEKILLECK